MKRKISPDLESEIAAVTEQADDYEQSQRERNAAAEGAKRQIEKLRKTGELP